MKFIDWSKKSLQKYKLNSKLRKEKRNLKTEREIQHIENFVI